MSELGNQFIVQYGPALLQIIVDGLLIPILVVVFAWLRSKVQNAKIREIIIDLEASADTWVLAANQSFVDGLKDAGKFDEAAQKKIFEEVMSKMLGMVTEDTMTLLNKYTGDGLEFIKAIVLAKVRANKLDV